MVEWELLLPGPVQGPCASFSSPGAGQRPARRSLAQVSPGLGKPGTEQAGTWAAAWLDSLQAGRPMPAGSAGTVPHPPFFLTLLPRSHWI